MNANQPIGIFDSGIGGLSVVNAIQALLPHENLIYFGDTARVPYGNKSRSTITTYTKQIYTFLQKYEVKITVVACNTACAYALDSLQDKGPLKVIGVIEPGIDALIALNKKKLPSGVIATKATVHSDAYEQLLRYKKSSMLFYSKACPLFVPFIEESFLDNPAVESVIHYYMDSLIVDKQVQFVILGCTHYPFIKQKIQQIYPAIKLIDSSLEVAKTLNTTLTQMKALSTRKQLGYLKIFVSDLTDEIQSQSFSLKYGLKNVENIQKEIIN